MRKAVLYLRSSKDRHDVSIDVQRDALQALATTRGLVIAGEFADVVESGKDEERPGFQGLYDALRDRSRAWDVILVLDTSRLSRRIATAYWFEERECKPRGVEIAYKNLPDMDDAERALVKAVFHGVDEWHSLVSKRKGLAGMRQNVQSGWRAGGRAPYGYKLLHEATGAVRDGSPVMKSKLVIGEFAPVVRAYLQLRAQGVARRHAIRKTSIALSGSTLIGMEWNALAYAGCTVWGVHAERIGGRAIGGSKRRPRSEWVVKEDTHEALISRDEAESLLRHLSTKASRRRERAPEDYVLSGLLYGPTGKPWYGCRDDGVRHYRIGQGRRVSAERIERSVVDAIKVDLRSPAISRALLHEAHRLQSDTPSQETIEKGYAEMASLDRRITGLLATLADTTAKRPLLDQIERWESERERIRANVASEEERRANFQIVGRITEQSLQRALEDLAQSLACLPEGKQRDTLRTVIGRIEIDPTSLTGRIGYCLPTAAGDKVASPRGFEPRLPP